MEKRIRKAIIPAAGLGTRFLPATKAMPKEMLPIVDIPTIQYVVEEAVESGIEEILIITNSNKHAMENHFDRNYELEQRLKMSGKVEEEKMVRDIADLANIYYVRQKEPKGLGHAILCARSFIGQEPFAVLLGDDIIVNEGGEPALQQLLNVYSKRNASVVAIKTVLPEEVGRYGIVDPVIGYHSTDGRRYKLNGMIEKPSIYEAPSNMAVLGRYIFTPEIFHALEIQEAGVNDEIQLTDAIVKLMETQVVYGYDFCGQCYDIGDKFGFIKATIDFALMRQDLASDVAQYLKNKVAEI